MRICKHVCLVAAMQADWELATWLSLPWRPYVSIGGRTVYTLNADANKVSSVLVMILSEPVYFGHVSGYVLHCSIAHALGLLHSMHWLSRPGVVVRIR